MVQRTNGRTRDNDIAPPPSCRELPLRAVGNPGRTLGESVKSAHSFGILKAGFSHDASPGRCMTRQSTNWSFTGESVHLNRPRPERDFLNALFTFCDIGALLIGLSVPVVALGAPEQSSPTLTTASVETLPPESQSL